jgi:phosphoribosylaminoimidazole (AIR) synthetase
VRVSWGRLENFKCVDYFQIEYYEKSNMAATVKAVIDGCSNLAILNVGGFNSVTLLNNGEYIL